MAPVKGAISELDADLSSWRRPSHHFSSHHLCFDWKKKVIKTDAFELQLSQGLYVLSEPAHLFVHFRVHLSAFGFLGWKERANCTDSSLCYRQLLHHTICTLASSSSSSSSSSESEEVSSLDCLFFFASGALPSPSFMVPSSLLFSPSPILDLSSGALFLFLSDSAESLQMKVAGVRVSCTLENCKGRVFINPLFISKMTKFALKCQRWLKLKICLEIWSKLQHWVMIWHFI